MPDNIEIATEMIRISLRNKSKLDKLKRFSRETYNDVIGKLLEDKK